MQLVRLVAAILIILQSLQTGLAQSGELEIIQDRLVQDALEEHGYLTRVIRYTTCHFDSAQSYLDDLSKDGSWPDVDYQDEDNRWDPLWALDHMLVLAVAYRNKRDVLFASPEAREGLEQALTHWYRVNPTCRNWYKNDIAKQIYLNVIAVLLQGHIDRQLMTHIIQDLTATPRMTGSNRTLLSVSVLYRGVLEGNLERLRKGVQGVWDQVSVTAGEGIQQDYSFHQHGSFLYNGSYGHNFLRETLWVAYILRGTSFALSKSKIEVLRNYYLEGTRWMIWKGTLDYNVRGRQVGRSYSFDQRGQSQIELLDKLMAIDTLQIIAYKKSKERILANQRQGLTGLKHFWRSDYTVNHSENYFTSLRMCSERTEGMEMDVNGENLLGHYLPFGLTYIYRTGIEYNNIFPVWDWARLPGVTSPHMAFASKGRVGQSTSFVGGVSNSRMGVSAMDLSIDQTRAKKSWFWFGKYWVALGNGITSSHEREIVTGINQAIKSGPIFIDGQATKSQEIQADSSMVVWHDSIGYFIEQGPKMVISGRDQEGDLQRIYRLGPDTVYQAEVFSIWVNHGMQPLGSSYVYSVMPGCTVRESQELKQKFSVLENTTERQVVLDRETNTLGAVFRSPGTIQIDTNTSLSITNPALVLWSIGTNEISVSDPTASLDHLSISWRKASQEGSHDLELPRDNNAGQSVTISIE